MNETIEKKADLSYGFRQVDATPGELNARYELANTVTLTLTGELDDETRALLRRVAERHVGRAS